MNASYIKDLVGKIKSGEIKGESELKLRNESSQTKIRVKRIDKLQKELKKRSKLFIPVEIAIPFNPMDGSEDTFHKDNKYRPAMSATSSALSLKFLASENETVRALFMKKANVSEWDTTPVFKDLSGRVLRAEEAAELADDKKIEILTDNDKTVFRLYRVPRIFTLPVVTIKDSRITGRDYGRDYIIKVDRDKNTGRVIGDMPLILRANQLYSNKAYEEFEHIQTCIQLAKEGKPYQLKSTLNDLKKYDFANILEKHTKEIFKLVYDQIPFSSDRPSNYMVVYEVPLNMELKFDDPKIFETITAEELAKMSRVTSKNKELTIAIDKFMDGTYSGSDKHYDFWELDMVCPMTVEDPDNKMLIGQATRYESPQNRLRDENFAPLVEGLIREAMDLTAELEKEFMFSVNLQKCDESIENKVIEIIGRSNILEDPFMTDKVLKANADFISLVFGEEGDEKLADVDSGFSTGDAGALDEEKAQAQNKIYNFEELADADSELEEADPPTSTDSTPPAQQPVGVAAETLDIE